MAGEREREREQRQKRESLHVLRDDVGKNHDGEPPLRDDVGENHDGEAPLGDDADENHHDGEPPQVGLILLGADDKVAETAASLQKGFFLP